MQAASRQALVTLGERVEGISTGLDSGALTELAGQLYAVAGLLTGQPRLRRTLADPATDGPGHGVLAARLLEGKISNTALQVVREAVGLRWSAPWDLVDALEVTAVDALFAAAQQDGRLDQVEDELFRFERILDGAGELTGLLDERSTPAARRVQLLDSVLADKVSPFSRALLEHAVTTERKRSIVLAIDDLLEGAARRRNRSVARVLSAVPLDDAQQDRLAAVLSQLYGRPISVRYALDGSVQGGLVIRVGDEVIDGSIASQLARARTALSG